MHARRCNRPNFHCDILLLTTEGVDILNTNDVIPRFVNFPSDILKKTSFVKVQVEIVVIEVDILQ